MKIQYFMGKHANFGDDLNLWMWPRLIPDFFDDNEDVLFLGTGSIIGTQYPAFTKKVVFGAGYVAQYNELPDVSGGDWDIYFVRGPRSARLLNISPGLSVGDSGILLRTLVDMKRKSPEVVSFMPHWESLERGNWETVCRIAGINLIDARRPVEEVIGELLRSKLVIAEAMHGAIVADAFRIPWIPLLPIHSMHREKWLDWVEALKMPLKPHRLWPSNVAESEYVLERHPHIMKLIRGGASPPFTNYAETAMAHLVANRLRRLSQTTPCLSSDREMDRVTELMLQKIDVLKHNYARV